MNFMLKCKLIITYKFCNNVDKEQTELLRFEKEGKLLLRRAKEALKILQMQIIIISLISICFQFKYKLKNEYYSVVPQSHFRNKFKIRLHFPENISFG